MSVMTCGEDRENRSQCRYCKCLLHKSDTHLSSLIPEQEIICNAFCARKR